MHDHANVVEWPLLTSERRARLLDDLARKGQIVAAHAALQFATSEDTIRRDLRELAAEGRLLRVHGGALPLSPTHRPLSDRQGLHSAAKTHLGRAAAALIAPGMTIIIDGGTTHLALVAAFPPDCAFTVVTHSPTIAASLENHARIDTILIGGRIMRHSMVALGPSTLAAYQGLRADLLFLGVTGLHPDAGLTTGDAEEAALKSALIRSAADCVVLATPDKIGAASPWQIAPASAMTCLVAKGARPDWLVPDCRFLPA